MTKLMTIIATLFIISGLQGQTIKQENLKLLVEEAQRTHSESIIIYHKDKVVAEEYFGIGNKDSLIESMSCTKSIVGLAAACLLDDGLLDSLNTPVYQYYPEWNQGKKKEITIKHLLTMTSGIQNHPNAGKEIYPSPNFVQLALAAELTETPGEKFRYNNKSLNLMSGIFLKITGKRMDEYVSERLLKPLSINKYDWTLDSASNPHVMSGFQVKPIDFIKFGLLLLNEGVYKGKQVISKENIKKVIAPADQYQGYGLLWWLDYDTVEYTVDDEIIDNLNNKNINEDFISKMKALKGVYHTYQDFENKVMEVFGENPWRYIQSNISSLGAFRKKTLKGNIKSYRADGYLGNYITVLPEKNLVGIRMISHRSFNHKDKSGKDGFKNFNTMLENLIE